MRRLLLASAFVTFAVALVRTAPPPARVPAADLWRQVEIIRTAHGVPHIRAEHLRAGGYALGWIMSEDYGTNTGMRLLGARGERSRFEGRARLDADFVNLRARRRAIETYHLLDQETRDLYDGFAAGVNRYIELHTDEFPPGMPANFTGYDVATLDIGDPPPAAKIRRFVAALQGSDNMEAGSSDPANTDTTEDGSNAWAFAPARTKSGKAILLRNPHLAWTAGYYEAHLTVPGVVDFYGDFRIGGPLTVIGGFNRHLGWATTNSNSGDQSEIYSLEIDPRAVDHYLLDGASLPISHETFTVTFKDIDKDSTETREFWYTPLGPVVHRTEERIFVARNPGDGEFRAGEQYLRMMRATSLAEWKDAMRLRALVTSNFTYADRAGNIFEVWNTALPLLPHAPAGDAATAAREMRDLWTRYVPFELLPQFHNPRGGYVHNENDSPHFGNVREPINIVNAYPNIEPPTLRLRSQHAIQLIDTDKKLSLEDVIKLKHSYKMLLADRVKPDLVAAVKATKPTGDVAAALALMEKWDNSSAPDSRGGMLFEFWFMRYSQMSQGVPVFAVEWTPADPLKTPRGLADATRAADAFAWAVPETARRFGRFDVAWGEAHRVRRGPVDVPVGGCSGTLGCFRVLGYGREPDGKFVANTGDGWVLAIEFGDPPRAYSVLAYGESPRIESPWYSDQAEMFARGEMKKVAFIQKDVDAQAVTRFRPGEAK